MTSIPVAEQFYSVQGEGPYAGTPAVFLRLAGCNLCCGGRENLTRDAEDFEAEGDATWVCDTIDVWREAERAVEPSELVEEWQARGWLQSLSNRAHLVLTGGEPLMPRNREAIIALIAELLRNDIVPFLEVETNGTFTPGELGAYIDQYNISMKLSNSGMPAEERIDEHAIAYYKREHVTYQDAVFKFVVSDAVDVAEIVALIEDYEIPDDMVMLMPAGQTQEQLRDTYPKVAEICKTRGWRFSPRLHVDMWNQATGV